MNYIIFDLEWNQSSKSKNKNTGLSFEIVEIGAVKLNEEREMIGEFSELIKPQVYTEMNYITSKIVHLHMKELEQGKPFQEVCSNFLDWCGEDVIFCTWGTLDLTELQKNMDYYKMGSLSDGPIKFYDIQKLFSLAYEDGKSRRSLEYAIDMLSLKKDIPFHRAFSDAYYTAKVFYHIEDPLVLEKYSFDLYHIPQDEKGEVRINFAEYSKYISRAFKNKTELMACKDVKRTRCYKCRRNLRVKDKWFTLNGKHYIAISYCIRHGFVKSKIRVKKYGDMVYAVKTERYISKEERREILEKKNQALLLKSRKKIQDSNAD